MKNVIDDYVRTCKLCQANKVEREQLARWLMPLFILEGIWKNIAMDFMTSLRR